MLLRSVSVDATEGPLLKKIFIYAIPLVLSTLIQTLFNAVDMIVLGTLADSVAVASIGATSAITGVLINSFIGLSGGTKIILSRFFGSKNEARFRTVADTAVITGAVTGIIVCCLLIPLAPAMLRMTNCPTECFEGALTYIRIYAMSAPFIMLYNFGASVLTSSGDTQRPMYYIIAAGVLNAVLNVILCLVMPFKVMAVAIATLASQMLSCVLVILRLCKTSGFGHLDISNLHFSLHDFGSIMRFGLPLALNRALYPFSTLQIQSAINSYGVSATAGNSAAITIENIVSSFVGPIGTTLAAFTGQNLGVKNTERVKQSFRYCLWISVVMASALGGTLFLFSKSVFLPLIVGNDTAAVEFGYIRMACICSCYWIASLNTVLRNSLQAYGYSLSTSLNSIITVFAFRFFWMWFIYPLAPTFLLLMLCYTVSWVLSLIFNIVLYLIAMYRFNRGKYAVIR